MRKNVANVSVAKGSIVAKLNVANVSAAKGSIVAKLNMRFAGLALTALLAALALPVVSYGSSAGFDINIGEHTTAPTNPADPTNPVDPADPSSPSGENPGKEDDRAFTHPSNFELTDDMVIADGIYAGTINIGKLSVAQAREALTDFYENAKNSSLNLEASADTIYKTTLSELGFTFDTESVIKEAAFLGKTGLLTARYKATQDLKYDKVVLNVSYSLNREKLYNYIKETIAIYDTPSQDASITRKNGKFVITPSVTGVATDIEATAAGIIAAVENDMKIGMHVEVVLTTDQPAVTGEALQTIQDLLGTYWTDYGGSADGRKNNIAVASANINGTVLMPGQQFSTSDTMKERNVENGYQVAGEYVDGATVSAVGGGVCQVATTLYQAVLQAELQVDKRYNHSMLVSYVEPSFDAAISWGNKDLVFTNNTEYPIYIEAIADGYNLVYNIYGKETRAANRKIVFENVIIERIVSETIIKEDPTQPIGYDVKTGSNHDACKSYLVKKIYIDGVLTDTVKFKEDSYMASYETQTIGTMPVPEVPTEAQPTTAATAQ